MKLKTEQPYLSPRLPVVAHLRPATVSPEIWPLRTVALIVLAVIGLSAACALAAAMAPMAAEHVMDRIDATIERMDRDEAMLRAADEEGGAL